MNEQNETVNAMTTSRSNDQNNPRRPHRHGNWNSKNDETFRGDTAVMQGHIFQVHGEHKKRGEFKKTPSSLERYSGKTYLLDTTLLQSLFKDLKTPNIEPPATPSGNSKPGVKVEESEEQMIEWDKVRYTEKIKLYLLSKERLTVILIALYTVTWGQCSKRMKDQIKVEKDYKEIKESNDLAKLLNLIKVGGNQYQVNTNVAESLMEAKSKIPGYSQSHQDTNSLHVQNI